MKTENTPAWDPAQMKSYYGLIPLSAKVHRRQTRMTRVCIFLAVFLVTVIFGMADMEIRSQRQQALQSDGAWHIFLRQISDADAALVAARPEIAVASRYDVYNYGLDQACTIAGNETVVCGFDEALTKLVPSAQVEQGGFPGVGGALLTPSARDRLGLQLGDRFTLQVAGRDAQLTVTGYTSESSMLTQKDALGICVDTETYRQLFGSSAADSVLFLQFADTRHIERTITDLRTAFGLEEEQITRNVKLLALEGQSTDSYMMALYQVAAVLAVLVIAAGVLMISGSLNSNILQRIEFFGLLRCLGATPGQIVRFVRAEALHWCLLAIPGGVGVGIVVVWGLSAMLKAISPAYFAGMPVFAVSGISIVLGTVVGLVTVLLAAQAPAKKAARVSPVTAVSGNAGAPQVARHAAGTRLVPVETALGVHHALGSGKNFCLMTGSFVLSIVLFLAFSTALDFLHHALKPLKPYTPDISVVSADNTCSITEQTLAEIAGMPAVKRVYGRSFAYAVPAAGADAALTVNLISYENYQFGWAQSALLAGDLAAAQQGEGVLLVYDAANGIGLGDVLRADFGAGEQTVTVCGVLSDSPFSRDENTETLICSEQTFRALTGQGGYTILDMQLQASATDADVAAIRAAAGQGVTFSDQRLANRDVKGAFYSMALFLYGFLVIIALISAFNIINSIAMSVSARTRQYGAMRAIGMGDDQLAHMVAAEAATYAGCGVLFGCLLGLPLHQKLFYWLVTSRWGTPWQLPGVPLAVIVALVALSTLVAVALPLRRLRALSIVETLRAE